MNARWLALGLLLGACDEPQYDFTPKPGSPTPPEGVKQPVGPALTPPTEAALGEAAQAIARARCDREARCERVGAGRKYATHHACFVGIQEDLRDELDDYECPGGVVEGALDACVSEIHGEACDNPLATLERMIDCDSHEICRDPNPRP
jgi:hypothetical protein